MQNSRMMLVASALTTWMAAAACGGTDGPVKSPADVPSASAAEIPSAPPPAQTASAPVTPPPTAAPPPQASATAAAPDAPSERMTAPLVLKVQGPDPVPSSGDIKIALDVVVREPLTSAVTLKVALPKGASLATGKAEEVLQLPQPATTRRDFVVRTTATLAAAVVFTADMKDAQGKTTLHAERKYPDLTGAVPPATTTPGPTPPGGRPPAPPGGRPPPAPRK